MVRTAHSADAVIGVYHNDLRCLKALARLKLPRKINRIDAHEHARRTHAIDLDLSRKITGIHKRESKDLAALLGIAVPRQSDKGIVVVTRRAAAGMYPLEPEFKVAGNERAFLCPPALEMEHIKIHFGKIDRRRVHALDVEWLVGGISDPHAARYRVKL